ncbi:MAG: OmpA family protein [Bacteroidia bacterium]|nr:OmpA family protein [Bacteroidia bacterium]
MPRFLAIIIFSLFPFLGLFGQGNLLKEADKLFQSGQYERALNSYLSYNRSRPGEEIVLSRIGICYYETNNMAAARQSLQAAIATSKKPNTTAHLYLAKSHHADGDFFNAAANYKTFLKIIKEDDPLRDHVRDAIKRCGSGIRNQAVKANAIVENIGSTINSNEDNHGAVLSPNYDDRIYFSSAKWQTAGKSQSDIYIASLVNGTWSDVRPLDPLNTADDDRILDFNEDGQALIYWRGKNSFSGDIMVDTFSRDGFERRGYFKSPINASSGDGGAFMFNDTTLLFHSYRTGGYGGADLYFSIYRQGEWSKAQNFGPEINSSYDEMAPFLSNDGSVLYFSSNNTSSIGGFDLFKSTFELGKRQWATPSNLGVPINSGKNDTHLRIDKKGLKGYLTSDRPQSLGKRDIFVIYFKNYLPEQQSENVIASLVPSLDSKISLPESGNPQGTVAFDDSQIKNYQLAPLYYDENDKIIDPANIASLSEALKIMKQHPTVSLDVIGGSDIGAAVEFDLYFSIKRAEDVANYLIQNGISSERIIARGCGHNYPVVRHTINGQPVLIAKKLNRRVDLQFKNLNGLPLKVERQAPQINNSTLELRGIKILENHTRGLSYRVRIALTDNMYNGEIISEYPDPMIDKSMDQDKYRYTVGLYNTYQSAQFMKNDLIKKGITDVAVIAFVNGNEVDKDAALELVDNYPDLVHFLVNE